MSFKHTLINVSTTAFLHNLEQQIFLHEKLIFGRNNISLVQMDETGMQLLEYARNGDISGLYFMIQQNPKWLENFDEIQFVNTPLHLVAAAGYTNYAIEIMNLMPYFGRKLNSVGLSPLHLAVQENRDETVRALISLDKGLIRVKGREGMTPLHYVAKMNRVDQLAKFIYDSPDSIEDLTNRFQSVAHVALENNSFEAFNLVFGWLRRRGREDVLGWKDVEGNTILHIAALKNQLLVVKRFVPLVLINKKNYADMTPLDIAVSKENKDVKEVLIRARAKRAHELPEFTLTQYLCSPLGFIEKAFRNFILVRKDLSVDMRNFVLLVAVLIATATYQAVLSPPGGVYQGDANKNNTLITLARDTNIPILNPSWEPQNGLTGTMVMPKSIYNQFMPANTLVFILSLSVIVFVLQARAYTIILDGCLIFLAYGYLVAMVCVSNSSNVSWILFSLSWCSMVLVFLLKMFYYLVKAMCVAKERASICKLFDKLPQESYMIKYIRRMVMQYRVLEK